VRFSLMVGLRLLYRSYWLMGTTVFNPSLAPCSWMITSFLLVLTGQLAISNVLNIDITCEGNMIKAFAEAVSFMKFLRCMVPD